MKLHAMTAKQIRCMSLLATLLLLSAAHLAAAPSQEAGQADGAAATETRVLSDMLGRQVEIPAQVDRVIASGSGALRLLTYLQAQDKIVAVDTAEVGGLPFSFDARPYAIANPQFAQYPVFGDFRGMDNPELILGLAEQPQVILKIEGGYDYQQLAARTGIPVVVLQYGNLDSDRETLNEALRLMAKVVGAEQRAEDVIAFFDQMLTDAAERAESARAEQGQAGRSSSQQEPTVYVGGMASRGSQGITSTEPAYFPFKVLHARNVAAGGQAGGVAQVAREQFIDWDPDVIFVDLATVGGAGDGLEDLRTNPIYRGMRAVQNGRVYGVLPYNFYTANHDLIIANTFFAGSILYPEGFADIDPRAKADEIFTFLNGAPAMAELEAVFPGMVFQPIALP